MGVATELNDFLQPYEAARLDDTLQEEGHRDVSLIAREAPASGIAFWSGAFRLPQNLLIYKEFDEAG